MRQIKASEIKPGMRARWENAGVIYECTVSTITGSDVLDEREVVALGGGSAYLNSTTPVTVLSEPQPEEPTAFGARVVVAGRHAHRCTDEPADALAWEALYEGRTSSYTWAGLCALGEVTVIDADPSWTTSEDAPEDTLVVPERIEEWPEDDEHLKAFAWADRDGDIWRHKGDGWKMDDFIRVRDTPSYGPWTRVTDA